MYLVSAETAECGLVVATIVIGAASIIIGMIGSGIVAGHDHYQSIATIPNVSNDTRSNSAGSTILPHVLLQMGRSILSFVEAGTM